MDVYFEVTGRSLKTAIAYTQVVRMIEDSGLSPETWLTKHATSETPKRSIVVYRSAVISYYAWQHWKKHGVDLPDDRRQSIGLRLTPTKKGRTGEDRDAPSARQFNIFVRAVETIPDPARTMLKLLPHTGLRISEVCGLQHGSIRHRDGRTVLLVLGKRNKERTVPLSGDAGVILAQYLDTVKPAAPWLFWRAPTELVPETRPVRTYEVESAMALLRKDHPDLEGVVPHSFRHLYATAAIKGGVDARTVQKYLGHEDVRTTVRYMHPDFDMLGGSADVVSSILARYAKPL